MISCSAQVFCRPLALAFSVQVPLALLVPPPKKGSFGGVDSSQDDSRSFDGHVMSCVFSPGMSQVRWANTFGKYFSITMHRLTLAQGIAPAAKAAAKNRRAGCLNKKLRMS